VSDQSGYAVLLHDDKPFVCLDNLLDLDVLVPGTKQEVGAVTADALVLLQGEREPFEASAGRALAHELVRGVAAKRGRNLLDLLVERPEDHLVVRKTFFASFTHPSTVAAKLVPTPGGHGRMIRPWFPKPS
jgi:hypothetical protein